MQLGAAPGSRGMLQSRVTPQALSGPWVPLAPRMSWESLPSAAAVGGDGKRPLQLSSGSASSAGVSIGLLLAVHFRHRRRAKPRRAAHGRRSKSVALQAEERAERPYTLVPHDGCAFGASVEGFDVRTIVEEPALAELLKKDLAEHKLLVFKGQTEVTGEDHIAISECLGSLDHGLHKPHPKAPDPRLLRVSNNEDEGFVSVGTSGWHVDGVMLRSPFAAQTMHFLHSIPGGDTFFMDMEELLKSMPPNFREFCRRLWFVSGVGDNLYRGEGQLSLLPLVFKHPTTGRDSMCFHLGRNYCLGWIEEQMKAEGLQGWLTDLDNLIMPEDEVPYGPNSPAQKALRELLEGPDGKAPDNFVFRPPRPIQQALQRAVDNLQGEARSRTIWRQRWEDGDLGLIDNLALAHLPSPGTQARMDSAEAPGLRLFHRTTMIDRDEEALPRNERGASSVLLMGSSPAYERPSVEEKVGGSTTRGAIEAPDQMGLILSALMYVSPQVEQESEEERQAREEGSRRGAANNKEPAWNKAVKALEEGGHSFELLEEVESQLEEAKSNSREDAKTLLKKLLVKLHPDRNPGDDSVVPVFSYLRDLRKIQGPTRKAKTKVLSRLRSKMPKKALLDDDKDEKVESTFREGRS